MTIEPRKTALVKVLERLKPQQRQTHSGSPTRCSCCAWNPVLLTANRLFLARTPLPRHSSLYSSIKVYWRMTNHEEVGDGALGIVDDIVDAQNTEIEV